jgi:hypothetical protein
VEEVSDSPITLLLRSILPKPQLVCHIQTLVLDGEIFMPYTEYAAPPPKAPVTGVELDGLIAFVERLKVPYVDL